MSTKQSTQFPWHAWGVGGVLLFGYTIALYDCVMSLSHSSAYFHDRGYSSLQMDYFLSYPLWLAVPWVISSVCGLSASIVMLLRRRWAAPLALVAAITLFFLEVATFGLRDRWAVIGAQESIIDISALLLTVGLYFYCRGLVRRGVLR